MSDFNVTQFEETLQSFTDNISKFADKGTAAAGKRARKDLLNMQKLCKSTRVDILNVIKNK